MEKMLSLCIFLLAFGCPISAEVTDLGDTSALLLKKGDGSCLKVALVYDPLSSGMMSCCVVRATSTYVLYKVTVPAVYLFNCCTYASH